jgi:iron complex transport system substrate-binding protein
VAAFLTDRCARRNAVLALCWLCAAASTAGAADVRDMLGRRIAIPDRPLRLVSLAPSITETVYALGREGWLVGVTAVCDYPPPARTLPRVGGIAAPSVERVVHLQPDLVLLTAEGNSRETMEQLERLGVATFALRPDSYAGALESMLILGRALGAELSARRIVEGIRDRVSAVQARVQGRGRPSVLYLIWGDPPIAAGSGSYLYDLLALAGGRGVAWERPVPYPRVSWEQIIDRAPEVILRADHREGAGFAGPVRETPAAWAAWQAVPAIRLGRVLSVPGDTILRPGPRMGEGVSLLARAIHPLAFDGQEAR